MATLTLKNVPDALLSRLRREARVNRRSLNQETLLRLEHSVGIVARDVEKTIADLRRLHQRMAAMPPIDGDFLHRARQDGRS